MLYGHSGAVWGSCRWWIDQNATYGHSGAVWGSCGWWIDQNATYGYLGAVWGSRRWWIDQNAIYDHSGAVWGLWAHVDSSIICNVWKQFAKSIFNRISHTIYGQ